MLYTAQRVMSSSEEYADESYVPPAKRTVSSMLVETDNDIPFDSVFDFQASAFEGGASGEVAGHSGPGEAIRLHPNDEQVKVDNFSSSKEHDKLVDSLFERPSVARLVAAPVDGSPILSGQCLQNSSIAGPSGGSKSPPAPFHLESFTLSPSLESVSKLSDVGPTCKSSSEVVLIDVPQEVETRANNVNIYDEQAISDPKPLSEIAKEEEELASALTCLLIDKAHSRSQKHVRHTACIPHAISNTCISNYSSSTSGR